MSLVLAALGVACGDQTTEVTVEEEAVPSAGMAQAPGITPDATATSDDGLMIATDKDDYQPSDTVFFTGSGWSANDTLDLLLEDEPTTHEPHTWWVPVQEDGTFRDSTYVVDIGDLFVTFTLTATSRSTGRNLQVTFTDGQPQDVTLDPTSRTVAQGGTATYDVDVNMVGNNNACTVTLEVTTALPAGAGASFSGNPIVLPNGSGNVDFSRVLTITTTGATPSGSHNFTVRATRGAGCQGSGTGPTTNGTLNVFGAANKLAFSQQPTDELSATAITPAVTVRVLDAGNNLVANSTLPITMAIGTNPGGGTLGGTLTQNAVNGVATFANLTIDKIGNGYTLVASNTGLANPSVTSSAFNITLGPAAKLAFFTQPSGGAPNTAFATQPRVEVQDAGGNRRTSGGGSAAPITLSIVPGTGTAGAALTCTTNPLAASAGLATFANCRINLAGTNYRLRATSGTLTAADSDPFDITAVNQPPNVNTGGPYTVAEGTELTLTPTVTDADNDPLTYAWTVVTTGIDAGGACTFDNSTAKNAKVTCTDDSQGAPGGKFTLALQVGDGTALVTDNADLTVSNANPVANAGGPYTGNEGADIQLTGSGDDPGNNDDTHLGYQWTVVTTGIDAGGTCDFDNASSKNAKINCTDDGAFKVRLVVSDDDGGTSVASEANLTVGNLAPTAVAGGPYGGDEGEAIQLGGSGDDPGDNDDPDLTYKWTAVTTGIDAGGTCTFENDESTTAKVTCTDDGAFKVRLVVEDDDGGTSTASEANLTVGNAGPVANAGGPYHGNEGSPVQLNGTVTDAGANDTHVWLWKYTDGAGIDGGTCNFDNANAQDPKITCTDDGTVELTLKVTDDDGAESEDTATLTLANVDPVADAGGSYSGSEGTPVQLNGEVTDAGTNDTHTWAWQYVGTNVDPGATCSFSSATAEDPTITCTDDGTVKLTLTVTDDDGGSDSDEATLTLQNVAPVAAAGGPYNTTEGFAFALGGSATDKGANDVISYKWTADASALEAGATCSFDLDTKKDAKITCTDDGVVTLTLKATDDDGGYTTDQTTLTLVNADPVADAGGAYTGYEGTAVQLNGSVEDAGANDTHTWYWKYVAGAGVDAGATCSFSSATAEDPTITCTDDGVVELTLKVTDDDGGEGTDQTTLTLANVAPVANAGSYLATAEGTGVLLNGSATDKGANDTWTYKWTVDASGIDAGGSCTITDDTDPAATVTCNDDGTLKVSLVATDDDGGASAPSVATIAITNVNPLISAFTKSDGSPLPATLIVAGTLGFKATFSDAGSHDTHTLAVDCGSGTFGAPASTGSPASSSCTFAAIGSTTIRIRVSDDDGGYQVLSHTMIVKYDFAGFSAPVDRPNTMNVSKAGQAIPLKWTLKDATGAPVTNLATVTVKAVSMSCAVGATDDQMEEYAAGSSGLQNFGDGRYQFNWKTPTSYAGSCKSIELVFAAGGVSYTEGPHAFFSFKK
jgi:hypothetical protein